MKVTFFHQPGTKGTLAREVLGRVVLENASRENLAAFLGASNDPPQTVILFELPEDPAARRGAIELLPAIGSKCTRLILLGDMPPDSTVPDGVWRIIQMPTDEEGWTGLAWFIHA